jgi:hypothetical protein
MIKALALHDKAWVLCFTVSDSEPRRSGANMRQLPILCTMTQHVCRTSNNTTCPHYKARSLAGVSKVSGTWLQA